MKDKVKYDKQLLEELLKRDNATLIEDCKYDNINRDTIIQFICSCGEEYKKGFRYIKEQSGFFCKICTNKNSCDKKKKTSIINNGVEFPSQSEKIKNKAKQTCIQKYGFEYSLQNKDVRDKGKETCIKLYGVENPSQSEIIKNKKKETCKKNYGVDNPMKNKDIRNKGKYTNIVIYGVEHPMKNEIVRNKLKETCMKLYGVEHVINNEDIKYKIKKTCIKNYGVEHPMKNEIVRNKVKKTCMKLYGVEHAIQNSIIHEKCLKKAFKFKTFTLPSGNTINIQGYENFALDKLLNEWGIKEEDIIVDRTKVPEVWWVDDNYKNHRYFADIYIPSKNLIIEVKSIWTFSKEPYITASKIIACRKLGFNTLIWIFDRTGNFISSI